MARRTRTLVPSRGETGALTKKRLRRELVPGVRHHARGRNRRADEEAIETFLPPFLVLLIQRRNRRADEEAIETSVLFPCRQPKHWRNRRADEEAIETEKIDEQAIAHLVRRNRRADEEAIETGKARREMGGWLIGRNRRADEEAIETSRSLEMGFPDSSREKPAR